MTDSIESLNRETLVEPFLGRDEARLGALRDEARARFSRNEFVDGWFLIRRSGIPGDVPEAVAEAFHSIKSLESVWKTLAVVSDPLALESLVPRQDFEVQASTATNVAVESSNWALLGLVALRLLEVAISHVEKFWTSQRSTETEMLHEEVNRRLKPLCDALKRAPWAIEIGMWTGVSRHLVAMAGRYSAFWEVSICQVVADRLAESEEARTSTSWLKTIENDVLVASLTIAAVKVAANSEYQSKLMVVVEDRIIKRLEDHPQHLLIDSISSHHLFSEAVGRAIAIASSENGTPPRWILDQLRRYELPWEGWGIDAIALRDACSRTAWLLLTMCIAGRMLKDSGGDPSELHSLIAHRITRDAEDWEWEFSHSVDSLRLLSREISRSKIALPQNIEGLIERISQAGSKNIAD